jgi:hypothetical protein
MSSTRQPQGCTAALRVRRPAASITIAGPVKITPLCSRGGIYSSSDPSPNCGNGDAPAMSAKAPA